MGFQKIFKSFILFFVLLNFKNISLAGEDYTSLIIDCSHLSLTRAMTPIIRDIGGDEIYPADVFQKISEIKKISQDGLVSYERSLKRAKLNHLSGKKPLIIRAVGLSGVLNSDPLISRLDSIKILMSEKKQQLFTKRKVIIVY